MTNEEIIKEFEKIRPDDTAGKIVHDAWAGTIAELLEQKDKDHREKMESVLKAIPIDPIIDIECFAPNNDDCECANCSYMYGFNDCGDAITLWKEEQIRALESFLPICYSNTDGSPTMIRLFEWEAYKKEQINKLK